MTSETAISKPRVRSDAFRHQRSQAWQGSGNPQWKGGVSQYPNHALMKRNRLIKLQQTGGKCEICGAPAKQVHHRDGSKDNHSLENLIVLCGPCHGITDRGTPLRRNSKYFRRYGMNLREMAELTGLSECSVHYHLNNPRLKEDFLARLAYAKRKRSRSMRQRAESLQIQMFAPPAPQDARVGAPEGVDTQKAGIEP